MELMELVSDSFFLKDLRTEEDCNIRRKIIDVIENEVASADLRGNICFHLALCCLQ